MISGWKKTILEDVATVERGRFSIRPRNDPRYYGGDIPFVQTGDIVRSNGRLERYSQTLNEKGLKVSKLFPLNTILMTIAANIGDTALTTFPVACPDSLAGIIPNKEINPIWLHYYLVSQKNLLNNLASESAQKNINLQILKPLGVLLPPLAEQKKIAKILSTWDEAIALKKKDLQIKKQFKKSLLQNTFNRKVTLVTLDNIAEIIFSNVDKKSIEHEAPVELCNYMDVYRNHEIHAKINFMAATASENEIKRFTLEKDDVLVTKDSESPDDIGISAVVTEKLTNILCGYHLALLRPDNKKIRGDYLHYYLQSWDARKYFYKHSKGATRFALGLTPFQNISIPVPCIKEQKNIAMMFTQIDKEIEIINQSILILGKQKQGLMQQLLTGKRRVKV